MWSGSVSLSDPVIGAELKAGESLLWSGRPRGGVRLQASDAFQIPFSLIWMGFVIFWEFTAVKGYLSPGRPSFGMPIIFPLWGIPFVLVGIYMTIGRFFSDAMSREKTHYAVTDQRVIIVNQFLGYKVKSLALDNMPEVTLNQSSDGSGSILFGPITYDSMSHNGNRQHHYPPSFQMIERVREVYDIVQDAQSKARTR